MQSSRWRRRIRSCWSRAAHWPRRRADDAALAEEIAAHLELEAQALEAEGLSPADARAAARRAFGNAALALEDSRAAWRWRWADDLARDLRLAFRSLAHSRGFAAAAIVTLALGIAATTTMFSLVDALFLRPVPIAQPQRVAILSEYYAHNGGYYFGAVSVPDFLDLRRQAPAFSSLAIAAFPRNENLAAGGAPRPVAVEPVQRNLFSLLGVPAKLGRTFAAAPGRRGRRRVAVISAGLWRGRFAASPAIIGRSILLNRKRYTVIGVMPQSFAAPRANVPVWVPLYLGPSQISASAREERRFTVFGRLRAGASFRQAQAQLSAAMSGLARRYRADHKWRVMVHPLDGFYAQEQDAGPVLAILMAASGLVLLLACTNVAALLSARSAARRHELALRAALGAGRLRLFRQLLAESALLAAGGSALGLAASYWSIGLFALQTNSLAEGSMPALRLDWRVAAFALAVAAFTVLLFGVAPAWRASRADPQPALREDARGAVGGRARLRRCLVAGEVALAIVLLAAAGLMAGHVGMELSPAGFGFDPRHLTAAPITLPRRAPAAAGANELTGPAAWAADAGAIRARLRVLPGVNAVATAEGLPLQDTDATSVSLSVRGPSRGALYYPVSPAYFATMRIPLLRGRDFTAADTAAAPAVAIVDRRFVRQYLHGRNAVGRTVLVHFFDYLNRRGRLVNAYLRPRPVTIVGVAGSVERVLGLRQREPAMYFPLAQWPTRSLVAIVRSAGVAPAEAEIRRAILAAAGPQTLVRGVNTMRRILSETAAGDRVVAGLAAIFSALALVLAVVGIYGVVAYSARRRTAEIGVRLALGAPRRAIAEMVLREAAAFAGLGWVAGLGLAVLVPRTISAAFGPIVLPTYGQAVWPAAVLIPLAALAASYVPARRAARLDPAHCLRHE